VPDAQIHQQLVREHSSPSVMCCAHPVIFQISHESIVAKGEFAPLRRSPGAGDMVEQPAMLAPGKVSIDHQQSAAGMSGACRLAQFVRKPGVRRSCQTIAW
jgi:hypothetical protein